MPLLKREAGLSPADFFLLPPDQFPWRVLHVRSRHEKLVARASVEAGIPVYLPLGEKRIRKGGRTFVSYLPLFPGYLFSRGDRRSEPALWRTGAVVRILPVEDDERLHADLLQLYDLQESGALLAPHPYLALGDQVRITDGVFAGYRGVVVREKGKDLLIVSVAMIHHSVSVELDRAGVVPEPALRPA